MLYRSFLPALLLMASLAAAAADAPTVRVYKTPTCGCCTKWADQLRASGLAVELIAMRDVRPIKQQYHVPPQLGSCHTATVAGYVIEGHVPVEDILRLLQERPDKAGIAVPGMPIGSPGMEGPNPEPFTVYAFDAEGHIEEFATHTP